MAKIYSPPAGYEAPSIDDCFVDGRYDRHLDDKIHAEYLERLATFARSRRNIRRWRPSGPTTCPPSSASTTWSQTDG